MAGENPDEQDEREEPVYDLNDVTTEAMIEELVKRHKGGVIQMVRDVEHGVERFTNKSWGGCVCVILAEMLVEMCRLKLRMAFRPVTGDDAPNQE